MKNNYYDEIAKYYDQLVKDDVENNAFPYAAYDEVQTIIAEYIDEIHKEDKLEILDIGIGTASLYEKIMPEKINVTGIDTSTNMLEIAKLRLPDAKLFEHDIVKNLPEEIRGEKFDFIVIGYLFKHFDIKAVTDIINFLKKNLAPFGKILIADIMFLDDVHKKLCLSRHNEYLTTEYHYHLYNQIVRKLDDNFALSFMEINEYTGIVIAENYYDNALQFEETLVKYKSNTAKWKSSHPQKKRE